MKMTRLLIFLIITIKIFSEDRLNIYLSFSSKHVLVKNHDYTLNEENNGISFEIQKGNKVVSLTKFDNSFYNESMALSIGKISDKNQKGFYSVIRYSLILCDIRVKMGPGIEPGPFIITIPFLFPGIQTHIFFKRQHNVFLLQEFISVFRRDRYEHKNKT